MFRLYISSEVDTGRQASSHVQRIFASALGSGDFDLTVIDVRERPDLADEDKVLATPTLIRKAPPPQRRLIGEFTDTTSVLSALGVDGRAATRAGGSKG